MLLSWFFWVTLPPQTPAHNPKKLPRDIVSAWEMAWASRRVRGVPSHLDDSGIGV